MAKKIKVQLGPNAYSFNDQSTGVSICRGEVKELTPIQANTVRVRRALNQGHLQLVMEAHEAKKYTDEDLNKLISKLKAQHAKGMEVTKVSKGYSLEEIKLIAEKLGYTVDADDTAITLLTSIFEEFESENTK